MTWSRREFAIGAAAFGVMFGLATVGAAQEVPGPGQSPTVDRIRKDGKLLAGVAIAWPWLGQDPKTGKYIGAAADLGEAIAQKLGVPIEYIPSGWDVIIAGLQAGQFELVAGVLTVMRKLAEEGITMVVVTHEMEFARQVGDRVVMFEAGRIVEQGKPGEILRHPAHASTQRFLASLLREDVL